MSDPDSQNQALVRDILAIVGVRASDEEMLRAISDRCALISAPAAIAMTGKFGSGLILAGTAALPGIGTVSGWTAALLLATGAYVGTYAACVVTLVPILRKARNELLNDPVLRGQVKSELTALAQLQSRAAA